MPGGLLFPLVKGTVSDTAIGIAAARFNVIVDPSSQQPEPIVDRVTKFDQGLHATHTSEHAASR